MTLKLAVVITGDASSLKSEAGGAKVAVDQLGTSAAAAGAGLAKVEAALETSATSGREAASALTAVVSAEKGVEAASASLASGLNRVEAALDLSTASSREASAAMSAVAASQRALEASGNQVAANLTRVSQGMSTFEASASSMAQASASLQLALQRTSEAQERLFERFAKPPANDNPFEVPVKSADQLRAKYDQLFAIGLRYRESVEEITKAHTAGDISLAARDGMIAQAAATANASHDAYVKMGGGLQAAGGAAKLTGMQVQGLGYQVNDVATMLAMGASPFQVMASQAGQVIQVLGEGPKGVRGSLQAIGTGILDAAKAVGPLGLALGGAALAAGGLWFAFRDKVQPIGPLVDRQAEQIKALRDAYGIAASGAEDYGRRSGAVLKADTAETARQTTRSQATTADRVLADFAPYDRSGLARNARVPAAFADMKAAADAFRASVKAGSPDFVTLENQLAAIENTKPDKAILDFVTALRASIRENVQAQGGLRETKLLLDGTAEAASRAAAEARKAFGAFRGLVPDDIAPEADRLTAAFEKMKATTYGPVDRREVDRYKAAMADLSRGAEQEATAAQQRLANLSLSGGERAIAEIRQRYDAEIEGIRQTTNSADAIAAKQRARDADIATARQEATRADTSRREGYKLDLQAITARTDAQRADVAAERARQEALDGNLGKIVANQRAEEARALSMAASREQMARADEDQARASRAQIEQAQLELDLVGKSAGEVARLQTEFQLLAAAKDRARSAGFDESTVTLTEEMRRQAAEVGRLTEATQRLNFERDLLFDRRQATRSPEEQRIAADLRSIGVEYDSAQGRADAAQLRLNNRLHETNELIYEMRDAGKDAFLDFVDAIGSGENAIEAFGKAFARIGSQMAAQGLDKIVGSLFGAPAGSSGATGGSAISALTSGLGAIASLSPASGRPAFAATASSFSVTTPTARPVDIASSVSAVSGSMMSYASRFNSSVDSRLLKILDTASSRFDLRVEAISGLRPGDKRFHGKGLATDVQIYGPNGRAYDNYQHAGDFRVYERFAQEARRAQQELFPELDKMFRWGGYFSGGKGKYGALDSMHFDLGGAGMGGGTWEGGLSAAQRRLWAGVQSVGMGESASGNQRIVARGVADGLQDYAQRSATGAAAAIDANYGAAPRTGSVPAPTSAQRPGVLQSFLGRQITAPGSFLGIEHGGVTVGSGLATAAGAFGGGYSSGSWAGGALSGAMAGVGGGPVGMAIGAIAGAVGGLFGGRQQREQKHRDAEGAWNQQKAAYHAFDQSLTGERGNLRKEITDGWSQLSSFMETGGAAWKYGSGNSTAQFRSTGFKLFEGFQKKLVAFQEGFPALIADLEAGGGTDGAFKRGRDAAANLKKQNQANRDDIDIAFGNVASIGFLNTPEAAAQAKASEEVRAVALERYNKAAAENALSLLYNGKVTSDTRKQIDAMRGAAAGLHDTFKDLGWEADAASAAINERLNKGLASVAQNLNESIRDEIEERAGVGHFASVRAFLKEFETLRTDVAETGADPSQLSDLFARRAQAIVDGAELTGTAFTDLVAQFPELSGVVREFSAAASEAAKRTAEAAADVVRGHEDRYFAATNTSDLAALERQQQREREDEAKAGGEGLVAQERAHGAERAKMLAEAAQSLASNRYQAAVSARSAAENALTAQYERTASRVESLTDFLTNMRLDDNLSPLSAKDQVAEAERVFEDLYAKAKGGDLNARDKLEGAGQDLLEEAKGYHQNGERYYEIQKRVENAVRATAAKAESELEVARRQASSLVDISQSAKTMAELLAELASAMKAEKEAQKAVNDNRNWGANPIRNQMMVKDAAAQGLFYSGNFGSGGWNSWVSSLSPADRAKVEAIQNRYAGVNRAGGGPVFGPGTSTSDSIQANLSNGEFVTRTWAVERVGMPAMEHINRTGTLPGPRVVALPGVSAEVQASAVAASQAAELREIAGLLGQVVSVLQAGFGGSIDAIADLGAATELAALASNRAAAQVRRVA